MKLVVFGATGMIGSRVAAEAVGRGHEVTAVSRTGDRPRAGSATLTAVDTAAADAGDPAAVAELAAGKDAIASTVSPPRNGEEPFGPFLEVSHALVRGARDAGVDRLVVAGGAGGLSVGTSGRLVDQPTFPEQVRPEALAQIEALDFYRTVTDVDWTYVSPAALVEPGELTGSFRVGGEHLLFDADGVSRISAEDYAVAFVDELESDAHPHARIQIAY